MFCVWLQYFLHICQYTLLYSTLFTDIFLLLWTASSLLCDKGFLNSVFPLQLDKESCRKSRLETADGRCEDFTAFSFSEFISKHLPFSSGASFYQTVWGRGSGLCRLAVQHHWAQSARDTHPWHHNVRPSVHKVLIARSSSDRFVSLVKCVYTAVSSKVEKLIVVYLVYKPTCQEKLTSLWARLQACLKSHLFLMIKLFNHDYAAEPMCLIFLYTESFQHQQIVIFVSFCDK